jgi:hypothetical protein
MRRNFKKMFAMMAAIVLAATFTACTSEVDNPVKPSLHSSEIDSVVWDSTNVTDIDVYPYEEYEKAGIKVKCADCEINWEDYGIEDGRAGIYFRVEEGGGFTFTNTLGKKFTKIELTLAERNQWDISAQNDKLGPGWPSGMKESFDISDYLKVTWTGKADSVALLVNERSALYGLVSRIVFYMTD